MYKHKARLRDVGDVKSRGCRKCGSGHAGNIFSALRVAKMSARLLTCQRGRVVVSRNPGGARGMYKTCPNALQEGKRSSDQENLLLTTTLTFVLCSRASRTYARGRTARVLLVGAVGNM